MRIWLPGKARSQDGRWDEGKAEPRGIAAKDAAN